MDISTIYIKDKDWPTNAQNPIIRMIKTKIWSILAVAILCVSLTFLIRVRTADKHLHNDVRRDLGQSVQDQVRHSQQQQFGVANMLQNRIEDEIDHDDHTIKGYEVPDNEFRDTGPVKEDGVKHDASDDDNDDGMAYGDYEPDKHKDEDNDNNNNKNEDEDDAMNYGDYIPHHDDDDEDKEEDDNDNTYDKSVDYSDQGADKNTDLWNRMFPWFNNQNTDVEYDDTDTDDDDNDQYTDGRDSDVVVENAVGNDLWNRIFPWGNNDEQDKDEYVDDDNDDDDNTFVGDNSINDGVEQIIGGGGDAAGGANNVDDQGYNVVIEKTVQTGGGGDGGMGAADPNVIQSETVIERVHLNQDSGSRVIQVEHLQIGGYEASKIQIDYLHNYRNPCFFEERQGTANGSEVYKYNPYLTKEAFGEKFNALEEIVVHSYEDLCANNAGCRLRCVPYFMVIGTAQSETIEFFDTLMLHGSITPPISQELSFWDKYRFIDARLNDYLDLFDIASSSINNNVIKGTNNDHNIHLDVTGEAAAIGMLTELDWRKNKNNEQLDEPVETLAHELYNLIPKLKLIFLLREPISHMYWHYNNAPYGRDSKTPEDFHRRVSNSINWWHECTEVKQHSGRSCVYGTPPDMEVFETREDNAWWPKTSDYLGALRDGLYWFYISDFLKVFPKDSFLFVRSEDYLSDPRRVLNEDVYPFMGLPAWSGSFRVSQTATELNEEAVSKFPPMLPATRSLLKSFFSPYNEKLAELLHDKKFLWKDITSPSYRPNVHCC